MGNSWKLAKGINIVHLSPFGHFEFFSSGDVKKCHVGEKEMVFCDVPDFLEFHRYSETSRPHPCVQVMRMYIFEAVYNFGCVPSLQVIWSTSKGNKILCLGLKICFVIDIRHLEVYLVLCFWSILQEYSGSSHCDDFRELIFSHEFMTTFFHPFREQRPNRPALFLENHPSPVLLFGHTESTELFVRT